MDAAETLLRLRNLAQRSADEIPDAIESDHLDDPEAKRLLKESLKAAQSIVSHFDTEYRRTEYGDGLEPKVEAANG